MDRSRVIFMGTPEFAVPILEKLNECFNVVASVTQPDKSSGRGKQIVSSPVKKCSLELKIAVFQPKNMKSEAFLSKLRELKPDVILVTAYGMFLPNSILALPTHGCLNIHASLLPRWRGASPIQAAILAGDPKTGITLMKIEAKMDAGDILEQHELRIDPDETAGSLSLKLSKLGAKMIVPALNKYLEGSIAPVPQDENLVTYSGMIKKEDGFLDFLEPADKIERKIRAYNPWPICYFNWNKKSYRLYEANILVSENLKPAKHGKHDKHPLVGTTSNDLKIIKIQPPGKKVMDGRDFLNGAQNWLD